MVFSREEEYRGLTKHDLAPVVDSASRDRDPFYRCHDGRSKTLHNIVRSVVKRIAIMIKFGFTIRII